MRALAEKIARAASPSRKISLNVKNISTVSSAEATAIHQELENDLKQRRFRIASSSSAEMHIHVTLSEGIEGYIWTAEIHLADASQTVLLAVPKDLPTLDGRAKGSLTLDARLVWEQAGKFLDFKLFLNPVGAFSTLVILGPEELAIYRAAESGWQRSRTIPIPHPAPWPRDLRGGFSMDGHSAYLPEVQCSGDFEQLDKVECSPLMQTILPFWVEPKVSGHKGAAGAVLWDKCGGSSIVVMSGTGDWTEPDTLQGYLFKDYDEEAVPSGSPVSLDGPVLNVQRERRESAARAVVRNLKTGNYEAYLVTATCSH